MSIVAVKELLLGFEAVHKVLDAAISGVINEAL